MVLRQLAALGTALVLVGCGARGVETTADEFAKSAKTAVAVVYGNTAWLDPGLHGSLALVQADGSFVIKRTKGLYAGTARDGGGSVHFSDEKADYRITADQVEERPRPGPVDQVDEWGGMVDGMFATVFNSGTRNTDDYHWDVSVWGKDRLLSATVDGELWGVESCGSSAYLLVGPWQNPETAEGARLLRMDVLRGRVEIEDIGLIPSGGHVSQYRDLHCIEGGASPRLSVLRYGRGEWSVGQVAVATVEVTWKPVPALATLELAAAPVGVDGGYVLMDRLGTEVWRLDADTGDVELLFDVNLGGSGSPSYSLADSNALLVFADNGREMWLNWYDLATGRLTRHVPLDDLASYFRRHDEVVDGRPLALR